MKYFLVKELFKINNGYQEEELPQPITPYEETVMIRRLIILLLIVS